MNSTMTGYNVNDRMISNRNYPTLPKGHSPFLKSLSSEHTLALVPKQTIYGVAAHGPEGRSAEGRMGTFSGGAASG